MLKDKIILITGSSKKNGIGRAAAILAAEQGAHVIVHGRKENDEVLEFAKSIGGKAVFFDAKDKDSVKDALKGFKRIDGLINCVGAPKVVPFLESTEQDWMDAYRTNVVGIVNVCQIAIPLMGENRSSIVNVSSVRGHSVGAGTFNAPYSAAKAALINLSVSLAKSLAPTINVNTVSPGFTETDFAGTWNDRIWGMVKSSLVGRVGKPHEIAGLLCFLMSDQAAFITGQDFVVDGGLLMSGIK